MDFLISGSKASYYYVYIMVRNDGYVCVCVCLLKSIITLGRDLDRVPDIAKVFIFLPIASNKTLENI